MQAGNSLSFQLRTSFFRGSGLLATHVGKPARSRRCKFPPLDATASAKYPVSPSATFLCRRGRPGGGRRGGKGRVNARRCACACARLELPAPQPQRCRLQYMPISTACSTNKTGDRRLAPSVLYTAVADLQQTAGMHTYDVPVWRCLVVPGRRIRSRISPQKT